jgi:hypothetical protein
MMNEENNEKETYERPELTKEGELKDITAQSSMIIS